MKTKILLFICTILLSSVSQADQRIDLNKILFLPQAVIPMNDLFDIPQWKKVIVHGHVGKTEQNYTVTQNPNGDLAIVSADHKTSISVIRHDFSIENTKVKINPLDIVSSMTKNFVGVEVKGKDRKSEIHYFISLDNTGTYHVRGNMGANCDADFEVTSIENGIQVAGDNPCYGNDYSMVKHYARKVGEPDTLIAKSAIVGKTFIPLSTDYSIVRNKNIFTISGGSFSYKMNFTVEFIP